MTTPILLGILAWMIVAPTPSLAEAAGLFAPERSGSVRALDPDPIGGSSPVLPAWRATGVAAEPVSTASVLPPRRPTAAAEPGVANDRPRLPELRASLRLGKGRPDTMTTGSVSPAARSSGQGGARAPEPIPGARFPVGTWAPAEASCDALASSGYLPVLIGSTKASAGAATCRYKSRRPDGQAWRVEAVCSDGAETWRSTITLAERGGTLRWSSARGQANYRRCAPETVGATVPDASTRAARTGKIIKG